MRLAQCLGLLMALALHTADLRAQTDDQYKMEIGAGVALVSYEGDYNGGRYAYVGSEQKLAVMMELLQNDR